MKLTELKELIKETVREAHDIDEYDVDENNLHEVKDFIKFMKEYNSFLAEAQCDCVYEAEYKGRKDSEATEIAVETIVPMLLERLGKNR